MQRQGQHVLLRAQTYQTKPVERAGAKIEPAAREFSEQPVHVVFTSLRGHCARSNTSRAAAAKEKSQ